MSSTLARLPDHAHSTMTTAAGALSIGATSPSMPDRRRIERRSRRPDGPRPSKSRYRVFMTLVFLSIVALDGGCDRSLPALAPFVGTLSIGVWLLTLLGSFGIGPIAALWEAIDR